jgi:hypothetical protein
MRKIAASVVLILLVAVMAQSVIAPTSGDTPAQNLDLASTLKLLTDSKTAYANKDFSSAHNSARNAVSALIDIVKSEPKNTQALTALRDAYYYQSVSANNQGLKKEAGSANYMYNEIDFEIDQLNTNPSYTPDLTNIYIQNSADLINTMNQGRELSKQEDTSAFELLIHDAYQYNDMNPNLANLDGDRYLLNNDPTNAMGRYTVATSSMQNPADKPDIYYKLATAHIQLGNGQMAYYYMNEARKIYVELDDTSALREVDAYIAKYFPEYSSQAARDASVKSTTVTTISSSSPTSTLITTPTQPRVYTAQEKNYADQVLNAALNQMDKGGAANYEYARNALDYIIKNYPGTDAATQAKSLISSNSNLGVIPVADIKILTDTEINTLISSSLGTTPIIVTQTDAQKAKLETDASKILADAKLASTGNKDVLKQALLNILNNKDYKDTAAYAEALKIAEANPEFGITYDKSTSMVTVISKTPGAQTTPLVKTPQEQTISYLWSQIAATGDEISRTKNLLFIARQGTDANLINSLDAKIKELEAKHTSLIAVAMAAESAVKSGQPIPQNVVQILQTMSSGILVPTRPVTQTDMKAENIVTYEGKTYRIDYSDGTFVRMTQVDADGKNIAGATSTRFAASTLIGKATIKATGAAGSATAVQTGPVDCSGTKCTPLTQAQADVLFLQLGKDLAVLGLTDKYVAELTFYSDSNGNVYMQRGEGGALTPSDYIQLSDKTFVYTDAYSDLSTNTLSQEFIDTYGGKNSGNVRFDMAGNIYTRDDNTSIWKESDDPTRVLRGVGDASAAYNYGFTGVLSNMVQKKNADGSVSYFVLIGTHWSDINEQFDLVRQEAVTMFGEKWADEYGNKAKSSKELLDLINARKSTQRFWTTFFDGSPSMLDQSVEDKFMAGNETGVPILDNVVNWWYANVINKYLGKTFFQPSKWEVAFCSQYLDFEDDVPENVQIGYSQYGPITTMSLQARKDPLPDNTTLYTVSYFVSPIEGKMKYSVCFNKCNSCVPLNNATIDLEVEAPNVNRNYYTEYLESNVTINYVSICYSELNDDDQVMAINKLEVPIVTVG